MTLSDALKVREGDSVTSPYNGAPKKPLRVTQVWHSAKGTIVQFRIHALGGRWIDSSALELYVAPQVSR